MTESEQSTTGVSHGPYELAALLAMFAHDLHPSYANTSRRGRGIGGRAVTTQCNYLDPEGYEHWIIQCIEDAYREWYRRAEHEGVDMKEVRQRIIDGATAY